MLDELRLGLLKLLRLLDDELRLGLLNEPLLRLGLGLDERLIDDELCPPPLRPPPPPGRCASAGVKFRARPTIARVINFEAFISLLLSY